MKKRLFGILGTLCAASLCAVAFTACSDGGGSQDENDDPITYTITVQNGTGYTLEADKTSAEEGETVTVTATATDETITITGVYYNSTACTEQSDSTYTFTMPAANVTVTATTETAAEEEPEPEPDPDPETMSVTFTYKNNTSYSDEHIFFNISDTSNNSVVAVHLSDFTDGEYTFEYIVGHTYQVSCSYAVYNSETGRYNDMTTLYLNEWVGSNVGGATNTLERTATGFALYILTLTTPEITVPFTINAN